ncbi:hypothetical protein QE152_g25031 [Popillia japonica]|uniref:Uncharacterized protein n=1 Tax=Popillia japonica TaxID=7064 RepID=A0AAW1K396_POPJA
MGPEGCNKVMKTHVQILETASAETMGPEGCNKVMKTHVQILETASAIAPRCCVAHVTDIRDRGAQLTANFHASKRRVVLFVALCEGRSPRPSTTHVSQLKA